MKISFEIIIPRECAKFFLSLANFFRDANMVLVCKGYGDDYELYTGLDWHEDKELDLVRDESYEDFRLWVSFDSVKSSMKNMYGKGLNL